MNILSAFGLLVVLAIVVAAVFTLYETTKERRLVSSGEIPPFNGNDLEQFKALKEKGYKSIALKRIRKAAKPQKIGLEQALEIYNSL